MGRVAEEEIDPTITTWLYRSNPGTSPRLSRAGTLRNLFRCDDQAVGPTGSGSVGITFEFPSDWLQLDKYAAQILILWNVSKYRLTENSSMGKLLNIFYI